jgi:hypothetical protein
VHPLACGARPILSEACRPALGRAVSGHAATSTANCIGDSIGARSTADDDADMQDSNPEVRAKSARVLKSAQALEALADAADAATVHSVLEDVEALLRATASVCEGMAAAIVPGNAAINHRYRRAAARWPMVPAPSYEQFGRLLGALHDTAGELRLAAGRCGRARDATRSLTRAPEPSPRPARSATHTAPA